jgi:hypothetical protein
MRYAFIFSLSVTIIGATIAASAANPLIEPPSLTRTVDNGGEVHAYAAKINQLNSSGKEIRIPDECYSACTMLLGVRKACVVENTALYFHAAYDRSRGRIGLAGTMLMASYYPPRVLRVVERYGWLNSTSFRGRPDLTGRALIALGVPRCGLRLDTVANR